MTALLELAELPPARIHRLPLPATEPPFDDERPEPLRPAAPGQQCLPFAARSGSAILLRTVPAAGLDDDADLPAATARADLPDPRPWASRFAQAVIEVFAGTRAAPQLLRWTSTAVYDDIEATIGGLSRERRPVVRSVHVSEPADGVAEACALVELGRRSRALALRFEGLDGRWRCTALQIC
ncbi:MAG TPA: Rv3235 family protein [Mycobacteriales bacterium]|nr:Rv3235 family protein [Mycobacteriales bacterium]